MLVSCVVGVWLGCISVVSTTVAVRESVAVFFTLTDRASTITSNIRYVVAGKVPRLILKKTNRLTQAAVFSRRHFLCGALLWNCSSAERYNFVCLNASRPSEHPPVRGNLFLTFSVLVANPENTTLHGRQFRSWSAEQGKKEENKVIVQQNPLCLCQIFFEYNKRKDRSSHLSSVLAYDFLSRCKFSTLTSTPLHSSRLYAQNSVFEIVHQESVKVYLAHTYMYNRNVQQTPLCAASCVTEDIPISPRFSPTVFHRQANSALYSSAQFLIHSSPN